MSEFLETSTIYRKGTGAADKIVEVILDPKRAGAKTYRLENGITCTKAHLYQYYTLTNPAP